MKKLPPGQKESAIFPRFGLPQYANRFPKEVDEVRFWVGGDLERQLQSIKQIKKEGDKPPAVFLTAERSSLY